MRVFVTGATGFVGSHVVRSLFTRGHSVAALVSPGSDLKRILDLRDRITLIHGRLGTLNLWSRQITEFRPEGLVHLAWYAAPGKYVDSPANATSLIDSIPVLAAVLAAGCRRIVATGSCFEYAKGHAPFGENSPTLSLNLYSATKLAFSLVARALCEHDHASFAWARLFYLFGPTEDPTRLVPAAIQSLLAGMPFDASAGTQLRDYLHVADAAEALVQLLEVSGDGTYNVCSGQAVSVGSLLTTVESLAGRSNLVCLGARPMRPFDPAFLVGTNSKLRNTGWAPRFSLEAGLADTLNWWRRFMAT